MIRFDNLTKIYKDSNTDVVAINDLSLSFKQGEINIIHGKSGSGKSTLLLMAGGMLKPDTGYVYWGDNNVYKTSSLKRNRLRASYVGFMFQRFYLIPYLNVYDNIRYPLTLVGNENPKKRISELAERIGIAHRLTHKPHQLSIGEQQRVALCRSIANNPPILLADEPTGNLDVENSKILIDILKEEAQNGRYVIIVTHDDRVLEIGNRVIHL